MTPRMRSVIKYAPAPPRVLKANTVKAGSPHVHSCQNCRDYYEDVCDEPTVNAVCLPCRTGHPVPIWIVDRRPCDCCIAHSRVARKSELEAFKLGGPGPWWVCTVCWRSLGFDPSKN